jgi:hypothetical protein
VDEIGMDGFNRILESPETIPTMAEIADPRAWITRVASAYLPPAALTAPAGETPRDTAIIASPEGPVSDTGSGSGGAPADDAPSAPASDTASPGGPAAAASSNGNATDWPPRAEDISLEEYLPPGPGESASPASAPTPPPATPATPPPAAEPPSASVFTPRPWTPADEPPADEPAAAEPIGTPDEAAEPPVAAAEPPATPDEPAPSAPPADESGSVDADDQPHS